jgi:NADH-quinone oxidoreductase subunit G
LCYQLANKTGMVYDGWNGFNVLHTAAARVGGYDLGFLPAPTAKGVEGILSGAEHKEIDLVYLLGADELNMSRLSNSFVVYQGHHGDAGAQVADVILPGVAYTEKNATYVNTEGRVQLGYKAVEPPGDAREDWTIIRALAESMGYLLPYNTLDEVRTKMAETNPVFHNTGSIQIDDWSVVGVEGQITTQPFEYKINNYYQTDVISRSSLTMALCTQEIGSTGVPRGDRHHG